MKPAQSLIAGLVVGTCRSSLSAGRTMSGSIRSSYESNAKPIAAMTTISHWSFVRRDILWALYYAIMHASHSSASPTAAPASRDTLDAWVREIVDWHFTPETGCPFWLEY